MKKISTAVAAAIDHHATELILFLLSVPFLIAYWRTRDPMIGTMLGGIVGGLLTICTKRAASTTNVKNVEKVTVESDSDQTPKQL